MKVLPISQYKVSAWLLVAVWALGGTVGGSGWGVLVSFLGLVMLWAGRNHERAFLRMLMGLWLGLIGWVLVVVWALVLILGGVSLFSVVTLLLIATAWWASWQALWGQVPVDREAIERLSRFCAGCGYDLRATPDPDGPRVLRCPECGVWVED